MHVSHQFSGVWRELHLFIMHFSWVSFVDIFKMFWLSCVCIKIYPLDTESESCKCAHWLGCVLWFVVNCVLFLYRLLCVVAYCTRIIHCCAALCFVLYIVERFIVMWCPLYAVMYCVILHIMLCVVLSGVLWICLLCDMCCVVYCSACLRVSMCVRANARSVLCVFALFGNIHLRVSKMRNFSNRRLNI